MTYTLGCLTKHVNNFWVLCGGRVLCGIATSLLFSAFESWLVSEHFKVSWAGMFASVHRVLLACVPRLLGAALPARCELGQLETRAALRSMLGLVLQIWFLAAPTHYPNASHAPPCPLHSVATRPTGWAAPLARRCSWATV